MANKLGKGWSCRIERATTESLEFSPAQGLGRSPPPSQFEVNYGCHYTKITICTMCTDNKTDHIFSDPVITYDSALM